MTAEDLFQIIYAHEVAPTEHLGDTNIVLCRCGQRFWNLVNHAKHLAEEVHLEMNKANG